MQRTPPMREAMAGFQSYERMPVTESGIILVGPSGSGKSTLRGYICTTNGGIRTFIPFRPLTTRPRRPGERDEYRFVTEDEMSAAKHNKNVIFGNESYGNQFLTLWPEKLPENQHYVYIYLPEAALRFKQTFPRTKIIQIVPENMTLLSERVIARDAHLSDEELKRRVGSAEQELQQGAEIADAVFVNKGTIEESGRRLLQLAVELV